MLMAILLEQGVLLSNVNYWVPDGIFQVQAKDKLAWSIVGKTERSIKKTKTG